MQSGEENGAEHDRIRIRREGHTTMAQSQWRRTLAELVASSLASAAIIQTEIISKQLIII